MEPYNDPTTTDRTDCWEPYLKTRGRTATRLDVTSVVLAIVVLGVGFIGPRALREGAPSSTKPQPVPSVGQDEGYVVFHIYWRPKGHPSGVNFSNMVVNGVRYQVDQHPSSTNGEWSSPRIPNHLPPEQVTAQLVVTINRPPRYYDGLWTSCLIEINGANAPGYRSIRGTGTDNRPARLVRICQAPVAAN